MKVLNAHNPGVMTGRGNNTYLLGTTLIDAGVGAPEHLGELATALDGHPLEAIIITHGHSDHCAGLPALAARWPGLVVYASRLFTPRRSGPALEARSSEEIADAFEIRSVADGDALRCGDRSLVVIETPGHAIDHICLFDRMTGDLFCGDMVIADSSVLVPPRVKGGSMRDYLASLERMRELQPARLLPGHGPAISHPFDRIGELIQHRLLREAQVAACLAEGLSTPSEIVARIYDPLPEGLVPFAEQNVIAHIEKIREGRS